MWRIFGGRKREAELDEELEAHIEIEARRLEVEGLSGAEAAAEARRTFGSRALVAELTRDSWGARWLSGIRQDVEYALRSVRRTPGFSATVVLSLGLGIGAATVVFSLADTVYLRPLPYRAPQRTDVRGDADVRPGDGAFAGLRGVAAGITRRSRSWPPCSITAGTRRLWESGSRLRSAPRGFRTTSSPRWAWQPALGRNFDAQNELPNAPKTALLTDALWRKHFRARPEVVGQNIVLDGVAYQVIGVLPPAFVMPMEVPTDILTPLPVSPTVSHHDRGMATWTVIGRLRPGVTQAQALANLKTLFAASKADAPEIFRNDVSVMMEPLQQRMAGNSRALVLVLAGAVGCLLLIACANVANLLLARWSARTRELAVRAAIGAGRGRLVRQLLTETAVWCAAGTLLGMALMAAGLRAAVYFAAGSLPRLNEVTADGRVFGIALGVSALTMLLFGVLPALRAGRVDVQTVLQHAGRPGMSAGYRGARRALVAGEVALSVVLLWGAVLLLETLWRMQHDHLGFAPEHVISVSIPLRDGKMDQAKRKALTEEMLAHIQRVPGTMAASWGECTPLTGGSTGTTFTRSDRPLPKPWDRGDTVAGCGVGPEYFQVSGMAVVRGRAFVEADYDHPQTVVVINEALARRYFPGEDPIGHQIDGRRNGGWKTVVGVVTDSKNQGLNQPPAPQMFINDVALYPGSEMAFVVRHVGSDALFADAVRAKLREMDPGLLARFETLDEAIGRMSAGSRFNGVLVGSFAASGVPDGGDRRVRRPGVRGGAADAGVRDPHGAGRGPAQCAGTGAEGGCGAGGDRDGGRVGGVAAGRPVFEDAAVRHPRDGHWNLRGGRLRDRDRGDCRRAGSGAAGGIARSDGGAAALVACVVRR